MTTTFLNLQRMKIAEMKIATNPFFALLQELAEK